MTVANFRPREPYSLAAREAFRALEYRVDLVFDEVQDWRGWRLLMSPETSREDIVALVREVLRSVGWYHAQTVEAGFHMFGRLPKSEVELIQALCGHKAEEAEQGLWALEDHAALGGVAGDIQAPPSPACFAVSAVWWRMAEVEEPLGYLGAEYLFEQFAMLVTRAALPLIEGRDLPRDGLLRLRDDVRQGGFLKHLILDAATRYPESVPAMLRCFDYFRAVYPLPVWDEAFQRARQQMS